MTAGGVIENELTDASLVTRSKSGIRDGECGLDRSGFGQGGDRSGRVAAASGLQVCALSDSICSYRHETFSNDDKLIVTSYNFPNAAMFVPNRLAPTVELYRVRCVPTPTTCPPQRRARSLLRDSRLTARPAQRVIGV